MDHSTAVLAVHSVVVSDVVHSNEDVDVLPSVTKEIDKKDIVLSILASVIDGRCYRWGIRGR